MADRKDIWASGDAYEPYVGRYNVGWLKIAATICAFLSLAAPSSAQVLMERNVSLAMAKAIAEGALEHCAKQGYRVVVVVVDRAGQMVTMLRADGVNPHNFELARRKAYTARTFRQTTEEFFQRSENAPSNGLRTLPDVVWSGGGGAPVKIGEETIGGVGVSGAPGGTADTPCAMAGLARVADALRP
jgi:uncharacterized protein GlcG (DUF336 family)